jgi:hypothetical protein
MVKVKATIDGLSQWQTRHVSTQTSATGGQNSSKLLFGLLDAPAIDSIVVIWPSGVVTYVANPTINNLLTVYEDCGSKICGTVYFDENQNNIQDASEAGISNQKITITPGNIQVYTNQDGEYEFFVGDGNYTVSQEVTSSWSQFSPLKSHTVNVIQLNSVQYCGNDFGNTNSCAYPNLEISLGTTAFRRGLTNKLQVVVKNLAPYNTTSLVQVSLTFTDNTYLIGDSWSSVMESNGLRTYIYSLNQIEALSDTVLILTDSVDNNALLGEVVSVVGDIIYIGPECAIDNNSITFNDVVVGSIDPNDKLVFVENKGIQQNVSKEERLTYKIRFQNIGTYAARRVLIVDQLSHYLDWESFKFTSSSHPFEYSLIEGSLTFLNNHIELPDSASDNEGSNGFIEFSIGINSNVAPFTVIENQALIQFDYNDFIKTNIAEIVVIPRGYKELLHVFAYPNPVTLESTVLLIDAEQKKKWIQKVEVRNLHGKILISMKVASDKVLLDFSKMKQDIYFVSLYDVDGSKFTCKVIKK